MIRVERAVSNAEPDAQETLIKSLDERLGAWMGCDVEAEGLYRRESMGCVDPSLGFFLEGNRLRVLAFTPIGHALLEQVRGLWAFESCPGGLSARFEAQAPGPHPVIGILRSFLRMFGPASPELALFGVFSFDYYRLAAAGRLPDDGKRRVVLYFAQRVLVAKATGLQWVEFRYPDLVPAPNAEPATLDRVRLDKETDDLPPGGHAKAVSKGIGRLKNGELFSLVLSQTFRRRASVPASTAFKALRALNPYPAMFSLNLGGGERLFGASPDLQVRADGEWVESAPVCGTCRRGGDAVADADQALALLNSDKEDASLAACADSDRNDKATVCEAGSLEVVSRRRVHFFSTIIHTIDHIRGRRRKDADAFDILLAHATPATVTGLPKPVAIPAIGELEAGWRGWYAGAVVRLASDGSMEALTVLRAARVVGDIAEVRTGGNLLVDSDPIKEEEETRLKAETLFRVLAGQSPRAQKASGASETRFKVEFVECGDPMGALLAECLVNAGCDLCADGDGSIVVLGGGKEWPSAADGDRPLLAIGASGEALLQGQGGTALPLSEPKYARRITAVPVGGGILSKGAKMDVGLYSSQVFETKGLPATWRAELVSKEGWVMAASSTEKQQVAILCRPDSVQSLKEDAGRVLVRAALTWLARGKEPS